MIVEVFAVEVDGAIYHLGNERERAEWFADSLKAFARGVRLLRGLVELSPAEGYRTISTQPIRAATLEASEASASA
jgi:hypothetical protein